MRLERIDSIVHRFETISGIGAGASLAARGARRRMHLGAPPPHASGCAFATHIGQSQGIPTQADSIATSSP